MERSIAVLSVAVIHRCAIRRVGLAFEAGRYHELATHLVTGHRDGHRRYLARTFTRLADLQKNSTVACRRPDADRFTARCRDDLRCRCLATDAWDTHGSTWLLTPIPDNTPVLSSLARQTV